MEITAFLGEPASIKEATGQSASENGTAEAEEKVKPVTERMSYIYSTPDGDLIFHFNLNNQVFAITDAGNTVSPPEE